LVKLVSEQIHTEGDLLFELYKIMKGSWEAYPKVTSIPKGKRITPDIVLLEIQRMAQPTMVGYEVELLRPSDPYKYFYAGLGEVINYFRYGS